VRGVPSGCTPFCFQESGSEGDNLLRDDLRALFDLQETDDRLVAMGRDREALTGSLEDVARQMEAAEAALEEMKRDREEKQKVYRDLEGEIKEIEENIRKFKRQEFDVKTNEALWAIQKEIREHEDKKSSLEDRAIEAIEAIDQQSAEIERAVEDLERRRQESVRHKTVVDRKLGEIDREEAATLSEREERRAGVPAELLGRYEKVREHNRGVGVARISDRTCSGCSRLVTFQDLQLIKRGDRFMYCEGCGAFLVWADGAGKETDGTNEEAESRP